MAAEGCVKPIGLVVRGRREECGFTPSELAKKAGLSRVQVWRLENSVQKSPGLDTLRKLARALGTQASSLVAESEGPAGRAA